MRFPVCLIAALVMLCVASAHEQTDQVSPKVTLIVSGHVKNFDALASHVVPGTYLQLVPLPANGVVWTSNRFAGGNKTSTFFDSDLPKLPVPKAATFTVEARDVPPGRYFLAVQGTNLDWTKASEGPAFLTEEGALYIIDVPKEAASPLRLAIGDLAVRITK